MASEGSDSEAEYALSRLLQRGTVAEYQKEFEILVSEAFALARVAEAHVQHLEETTFHKSNKVEETEARFEAIAEKEQNIKEKVDTTLSLPRPVDEVSSVIEDVFDIDESNVEGMHVCDKFVKIFKDKGSMKKVLSATKLPKGGNSHSTYSPYHLEDKVNFEGVGNITPWAAKVGRRKRVKCYVQGSGRRKRKKVIRRGSGRRKVNQECFSRHHLEGKVIYEGVRNDTPGLEPMAHLAIKELAHAKSGANLSLLLLYILTEQAHAKSGALSRYNPNRV
ncbi:hypothetical protein Tco_0458276, partial [Tanacetum coccineum]